MNNKTYIIIGIVIAVLIIVVLAIFALLPGKNEGPAANKVLVPSETGQQVEVNDFKSGAQLQDDSAFILKDLPDVAAFLYNEESGVFNILIHATEEVDFNQKRTTAEASFLEQLGITAEQACTLKVEVSTDGPENDLQSFSKVQGLSFCQ